MASAAREVSADSTPLQIWEGTVLSVDHTAGTMQVLLDAKTGQMPRHTGEISLDDVSAQDQDLVCPGAVFYLTLCDLPPNDYLSKIVARYGGVG